ncbi:cupin-like domain-containing protein [Oleiagrimonas sp. C23AA]|uniref:cupin-like domain-containing protein n=1 Tax=Oleiagrimonas sp. C23AA TaxID=2719047 RepID=UPI00142467B2|nr:cupin-like domain-containing protein [Oleiagrimonas sp. C23AA]NII11209.1 cupin-like domain-containing protein [Oleiagrimonas sp. C23AA]
MPEAVAERHGLDPMALPDEVLHSTQPLLLRGLVADWPMVQAARCSPADGVAYLNRFDRKAPVVAMVAPPESGGRFFYNQDLSGFNFQRQKAPLAAVLDTLLKAADTEAPPAIYVGSTTLDTYLPGFRQDNPINLEAMQQKLASIWIGNRSRIAAHQDLPDNLACVVAGRRRFTLFPPDQLANLYIGPLDFTPAGQAISLVDFHQPDFERFPRFAKALEQAQVAELEAGDALMIPSMWWHHVEALEAFNVLVNFWWRRVPGYMDTPMNALMLALMSIRDLPPEQRRTWQETFRHYVFEPDDATAGHIPESARRVLAPIDETTARELRAHLLQRLNR